MRTPMKLVAVPLVSASLLLSSCGGASTTTTTSGGAASTAVAGSTATDAAASCPTENTQAFAKTRFVTNLGLATGAFYQWIYKPYQKGTFQKGASGRTFALVKAGAAGLFAGKQLKDATNNVKADPTLCKVFITPMTQIQEQLGGLADKLRSGDTAAVTGLAGSMTELTDLAKTKGIEIVPKEANV